MSTSASTPDPASLPTPIACVLADLQVHIAVEDWLSATIRLKDTFDITLRTCLCLALSARLHATSADDDDADFAAVVTGFLNPRGLLFSELAGLLLRLFDLGECRKEGFPAELLEAMSQAFRPRIKGKPTKHPIFNKLSEAVQWRNHVIAHGALMSPRDYREKVQYFLPLVETLLASLNFLRDDFLCAAEDDGSRLELRGPRQADELRHIGHRADMTPRELVFGDRPPGTPGYREFPLGPWMGLFCCDRCEFFDVFYLDKYRRTRAGSHYLHFLRGHKSPLGVDALAGWSDVWERSFRLIARPARHDAPSINKKQEASLKSVERERFEANYIEPEHLIRLERFTVA